MKKLLTLLLLLPSLAFATNPSVGGHTINSAALGGTTFTSSAITTTSGDTLVVFISISGGTATVTMSDSKSNSCWTQPTISGLGNPVNEANDGAYLYVEICPNITGGAGHTVSVSIPGNVLKSVDVIDVANAATSSPIDVSNSAYATSYPLSASVSPAASGDLVIGVGYSGGANSATVTPTGTGFTGLDSYSGSTDFTTMGSATRASAPSGSNDPLMTDSHAGEGFTVMTLAIKGTGGGATTPPSQLFLGASFGPPVSLEAMAR